MKTIRPISAVAALAACIVLLGPPRESTVYGANPVGSQESSAAGKMTPVRSKPVPTWSRDVASILYKNCATCHHPGGAGPFSVLTYADAQRWGAQAVTVTQSRYMPPWLPEPGHGDFADNRRLSDADIATLRKWFSAGMLEGNPTDAPI